MFIVIPGVSCPDREMSSSFIVEMVPNINVINVETNVYQICTGQTDRLEAQFYCGDNADYQCDTCGNLYCTQSFRIPKDGQTY